MPIVAAGGPLLSLPAELRLHIAAYVLEQPRNAGLTQRRTGSDIVWRPGSFVPDATYSSASNLHLLLVCRLFYNDFVRLAYEKTTFMLRHSADKHIDQLPTTRLQSIRKVIVPFEQLDVLKWQEPNKFFIQSYIRLESLSITNFERWDAQSHTKIMVDFLRHVENIESIRIILQGNPPHKQRNQCWALVGAVLKDDHYQRYDAPDAPNLENTWWNWSYDRQAHTFSLTAQEARPFMEEEAYMVYAAPLIHGLMDELQVLDHASSSLQYEL
ncbi:hypothetical protein T440DRAFT_466711 [Plenodomus tracheiphilus IPT5]|uniref:Uncharacterized protein n=1 Tax=Plenodomus tracheiphilus IPT5 TaxID=1408161 RepID=A0A6A7BAM2_9PLEO|nr:hypothetical protein T440DRAFT_466711 [Plenodomus tracheiphilus IPT5]